MRKMSNTLTYLMINALLLAFVACDDEDPEPEATVLEVNTVEDLMGDGQFAFYDLEEGAIVPSADSASTKWDLAFRNLTILVNGGTSGPGQAAAQVVDGIFDELEEAPADGYLTDSEAGTAIQGWYNYTGSTGTPAHAVLMEPGKIIVLKTGNGNYAKVELISYYRGNPDTSTEEFANTDTRADNAYFTFRYVIQPDGSRNF